METDKSNMKKEQLKKAVKNIRTLKKNGERAPHKPLLILYALGRGARGEPQLWYGRMFNALPWAGDKETAAARLLSPG